MQELRDTESFDAAVANGALIVNVDEPTRVARLHLAPARCPQIRDGFLRKVVENDRQTGSYWIVDATAARRRWGEKLMLCKVCG